jgi:broad specificity polyphosphatase/5'/3'-nucleotidase SurE
MGFPTIQSEAAIHSYGTVQAALEALLAGKGNN